MNTMTIGYLPMPRDFKYTDVIKRGMPDKDEYFYMKHPHMPFGKRAKIFSPFAALRGFEEEVESKEVLYVRKKELDTDEYYELNDKLARLHELTRTRRLAREIRPEARIEYYVLCTDKHNEAYNEKGTYQVIEGTVTEVDQYGQKIMIDELTIDFGDISRIDILSDNSD